MFGDAVLLRHWRMGSRYWYIGGRPPSSLTMVTSSPSQTNVDTYFEFTAPSNGTLALKRDGWNPASFTIKEKGGNAESSGTIDYADNSVKFNNFTLEAGKAYIIRSVAQYDEFSESYTVVFTGEGGDLGDGSLENPYKVKANEEAQINVAPWSKAYVELTPEADGSLKNHENRRLHQPPQQ